MKRLLIITGALILVACTPNEADFKSVVPVIEPPVQTVFNFPKAVNLKTPFFPQAPDANWELPWQEACEEASVILVYYGATSQPLTRDQFRQEILKLVDFENRIFGDYKHTNIDQTAQMLQEFYGYSNFQILSEPSVEVLKKHLAQGHLIIAPFAGRLLGNPFYRGEGPLYHMLVIKGYDDQHFITNDVGTKRGENFIYPYSVIMNALHEWRDEEITLGARKVIVVE